jgi:hypothetical protein
MYIIVTFGQLIKLLTASSHLNLPAPADMMRGDGSIA